ncbi:GH25 family lysozyme [Planosporangium sp. 12N6]|uniref:GH25 family lysozyme n=1 Tax=Planosporangium spinosum TaxID=3402278 RepID=UPI003CF7936C
MPPCRFSAGIDASDYDWDRGPMDLTAAARDGISFFTHKATEGTQIRHAHYGDALNRAAAAGIPLVGAYIVVRTPGNNGHGSIQAQVNYFVSYLDAQTPWWRGRREFFVQVDLEHWGYDDVAPQYGVQACGLLRSATGKWVVLYAPRWAYGNSIPGNDPLWASAYGTNPAVPYRQAYRGDDDAGWSPYSGRTPIILQYGSSTTIGSQPTCDANAYRGTGDQFRGIIIGGANVAGEADLAFSAPYTGTEPWISGQSWMAKAVEGPLIRANVKLDQLIATLAQLNTKLDQLSAKLDALQAVTAPTQDQVDVSILKAMQDPAVQQGIGDAIASHLHVS